MITRSDNKLIYRYDSETLWIEAWGENAVRIRATKCAKMPDEDWALTIPQNSKAVIEKDSEGGVLKNGEILVRITQTGKISISRSDGKTVLEEYWRNRRDIRDPK